MPPAASAPAPAPAHRIAIIGAGFAGIGMAIRLKQAGIEDFVILEQAREIGGTWRDNTYPGCACDIPSHLYSFSFAPSADWTRHYPSQAEIQAYLLRCVDRFGLRPHLRLGCTLSEARFDAESAVWHLVTESAARPPAIRADAPASSPSAASGGAAPTPPAPPPGATATSSAAPCRAAPAPSVPPPGAAPASPTPPSWPGVARPSTSSAPPPTPAHPAPPLPPTHTDPPPQPSPTMTAQVLILGLGMLHRPAIPDLPGLADFRGSAFHSARWDHSVPLAGRRVAVIGTGASAIQLVPRLAQTVAQLTLFQRTPAWILPKRDRPIHPLTRWALRHVPLLRRTWRAWLYWSHESRAVAFVLAPMLLPAAERRARSFAKRLIPDAALRSQLTPDYPVGCKRVLLSNDFLPVLTQPQVRLVAAPIARILPDGVATADGETVPADVLVLATGFQATNPLGKLQVIGADGTSLHDAWRDGMHARLGLAVAGFPNLFLLGGPNTGLGHNSVVFMLEAQIAHVLRALRRMRQHRAATIEVAADAERQAMQGLSRRMQRTVWLAGCRSWYLDGAGRNTTLWPGFSIGYWLRTRLGNRRAYRLGRSAAASGR